ncbi:tetratricopeptide repeat protein [Ursidibacter arcticus]
MCVTFSNKNSNKSEIVEKNYDNFSSYLKSEGKTWKNIAKEYYYKKTEDDEYTPSAKDDEMEINKFTARLKNSVRRGLKKTSLNKDKKIKIKDIFDHYGIVYICEAGHPSNINKKNSVPIEDYKKINSLIIENDASNMIWSKFEEEILDRVKIDAKNNIMEAKTLLGNYCLYYGENKIPNVKEARELFESAKGDEIAAYQLGRLYEYGYKNDIVPDLKRAVCNYEFSARKGMILALEKMAYIYLKDKKINELLDVAGKLKELNNIVGFYYLGLVYFMGIEVDKDLNKAIKIYEEWINKELPYIIYPCIVMIRIHKKQGSINEAKSYLNKLFDLINSTKENIFGDDYLFEFLFNVDEMIPTIKENFNKRQYNVNVMKEDEKHWAEEAKNLFQLPK